MATYEIDPRTPDRLAAYLGSWIYSRDVQGAACSRDAEVILREMAMKYGDDACRQLVAKSNVRVIDTF